MQEGPGSVGTCVMVVSIGLDYAPVRYVTNSLYESVLPAGRGFAALDTIHSAYWDYLSY